jgi:uncharacterized membrane protein
MDLIRYILDWCNNNPGRALGALAGFILGIMILTLGILKTLLVFIFIAVGFLVGKSRDENSSLADQITKIFKRK